NEDQQYARMAGAVADRINETFHGNFGGGGPGGEIAAAKKIGSGFVVVTNVPPQYRHNLPPFLRVVCLIPLPEGGGEEHRASTAQRAPYRRKLEEDLLDPARTVTAALRLEALGNDSVGALKAGLQSPHALVRFCCAEGLAYLGSPACGEELARTVEQ